MVMKFFSKKSYQNILLLIGSIIFSAILAEVVLRTILPAPITWKYPQEFYIYDPEIGFWLEPNQKAFTHDKIVTTNSVGIRDSEYSPYPPPNTYRILALGDSQTFGNGLDLVDTWPKQLETILNKKVNNLHFEVLNAGIPGSATWHHEIILQRMINNYHPDMVVLGFYVNDVSRRTSVTLSEDRTNTLKLRIVYILKQSALLLTFRSALSTLRQKFSPDGYYLWQIALLNGGPDQVIEDGWEQVEKSFSAMKKTSNKNNTLFLVASLPRRDQVSGNLPGEAYNIRLEAIARKNDISMKSMLGALEVSFIDYGKDLFIPWDGHNSEIGNFIIAREIANFVLESISSQEGADLAALPVISGRL
jgi:hypothetical protein